MNLNREKLIVALDVPSAEEARGIFEELNAEVGAFKIGMQLFTAAGAAFVHELVEKGAKIFLDLKFHDIPNTVASAGIEAARLGVWMFNVHASGGREMMERTVAAVRETVLREGLAQPKIIAVTVLTSSNADTLREVGIDSEPLPQVVRLARLTKESGLDGVVASALEASAIKEAIGEDFLIVTPGVRPTSAEANDQKRILTPVEAVKAGATHLVVGRPILAAQDKVKAAQEILAEIEAVNS
jgi:orotidine-5'-phosphate decarboxylase